MSTLRVHSRPDDDAERLRTADYVARFVLEAGGPEPARSDSLQELAESRARISAANDVARHKLERDLHDGAQQRLLAVLLKLDVARELAADRPELHEKLGVLAHELEDAIDELRELGHGIYPTVLANSGLAVALQSLAARSAGRVTFTDERAGDLPTEIETPLYFCCVEAVQNATKHAGPATRTSIRLYTGAGELHLEVGDNGKGFDVGNSHEGVGLRNIRDRLGAVHGRLEITSERGRGTLLVAAVPISLRDPSA